MAVAVRKQVAPLPPGLTGLRALPLFGKARTEPLSFFAELRERYGDIVRFGLAGPACYTLLFDPAAAEHVLAHNHKNYRKGRINEQFRLVDGNGLIISEGSFWQRQRRLAQPAFHRTHLQGLVPIMRHSAEGMVQRWDTYAESGRPLAVMPEMMRLTLQIASLTLFTVDISGEVSQISRAVDVARNYLFYRMTNPFRPEWLPTRLRREFQEAMRTLDGVVYGVIGERRRTGEDTGDLLSQFMLARDEETGEGMTDAQLRDEVMTMMNAGHETTAVGLTWAWYLLAAHTEVQERVRAELREVLGGRAPEAEDLPRLRYTRMVFEETLRLYPPAWGLSRAAIHEDELCGYRVPAGTYLMPMTYHIQRDPRLWPDPERFDPERFAPEKAGGRPRFAYFPFGGGPRGCIGSQFALMEAQVVLASVLQRYGVGLAPGQRVELEASLSLRPREELMLQLSALPA